MPDMTVTPAYGRDYRSAKEAREAWESGVDFRDESFDARSTYCSIRDAEGRDVRIRYANKTKVLVYRAVREMPKRGKR